MGGDQVHRCSCQTDNKTEEVEDNTGGEGQRTRSQIGTFTDCNLYLIQKAVCLIFGCCNCGCYCPFVWIKYFWESAAFILSVHTDWATAATCHVFFCSPLPAYQYQIYKTFLCFTCFHSLISHPLFESPMTYSYWWIFPVCIVICPFP